MDERRAFGEPRRASAETLRVPLKRLLTIGSAFVLGYVLLQVYLNSQGDSNVRRAYGGPAGISILRDPQRVEAYRIGQLANENNWQNAGLFDYPILSGPVPVSQPDAETLTHTLQDRSSYYWNARKGCIVRPGVRLDFVRGDDRLSLLLCFECDLLQTYLNGKRVGSADFDYARPTLVQVAHSLFPNDPQIQSLAAER
jgi:hypothetical protein